MKRIEIYKPFTLLFFTAFLVGLNGIVVVGQGHVIGKPNQIVESEARYESPLLLAIARQNLPAVQALMSSGVSPNVSSGRHIEQTPILLAVLTGNSQIVSILLQNGADPNSADSVGSTGLMIACFMRDHSIVELLVKAKADVNKRSSSMSTALMTAARYPSSQIVNFLLKAGAEVDLRTDTGSTALMIAAEDSAVLKAILDAGASIELVDENGWSALFHAVAKGELLKTRVLLESGSKVSVADKKSRSILTIASEFIQLRELRIEMQNLLSKFGAWRKEQGQTCDSAILRVIC